MKQLIQLLLVIALCLPTLALAQFDLTIRVVDAEDSTPIPLANILIVGTQIGSATDVDGFATLKGLTGNSVRIKITMLGYESVEQTIALPALTPVIIMLEHHHDELGEVTVSATRGSRLIDRVPTRVEVISGEELEEKANMNSSNITMLLRETPGIQVQQTDLTSASMSFRIQGLDGRYTQLLQDGMPIYGGFAGSLSLVQIPPLNLKQVEIVKGSASTLYGGGAIAGLVNLVTKTYKDEGTDLMVNALSTGGADVNFFSAGKFGSVGYSTFVSVVAHKDHDVNDDAFADIPKTSRIHLEPTLWVPLSSKTIAKVGVAFTDELREGGFMRELLSTTFTRELRPGGGPYQERLSTQRVKYQLGWISKPNATTSIEFKNVLSQTSMKNRDTAGHRLNNDQTSIFSEATVVLDNNRSELMLGMSFLHEEFKSKFASNQLSMTVDPEQVYGFFAQNVADLTDKLTLETGLRLDMLSMGELFLLPRVNVMYKWNSRFTSRIGGGTGYKTSHSVIQEFPNIIWHESHSPDIAFHFSKDSKVERSFGLNADVDYKTVIGENLTLSVNQMFFYTKINDPIFINEVHFKTQLADSPNRTYELSNRDGFLHSRGTETNVKLGYKQLKLFQYYTFTSVNEGGSDEQMLLTPKHRLGSVLMLEKHGSHRIGFEAYYTGIQQLSDNKTSPRYMIYGFMAEKTWNRISFFINFENFTDTRYSERVPLLTNGTATHPSGFSEIYAPMDGRVINGGIKIRL